MKRSSARKQKRKIGTDLSFTFPGADLDRNKLERTIKSVAAKYPGVVATRHPNRVDSDPDEYVRSSYAGKNQYALVVEVRGGERVVRSTLIGREQAQATAIGAFAVAEALASGEVDKPGV